MRVQSADPTPLSTPALIRFLTVVFAGGILAQLAAVHAGLKDGAGGWLLLTSWMPALAAFTTSRVARRMAWASLRRLSVRWLGIGLLIGGAPALIKTAMLAASDWGRWDSDHFELASDGWSIRAIHHLAMVLGVGPQSFAYFALNLLLSITLGSVITALIGTLGEELGWRAVLQPSLERRFGRFTGTCFVGLIWAYWHLPVNLAGYNDPVHPVWTALVLFPLGVVAMSFGFAWLFRESQSVWPSALAHGANNTLGSAFLMIACGWPADNATELLGLFLVGGVFAWGSWRHARDQARQSAQEFESASSGAAR